MPKRNRHAPEQIIRKLREAEVGLSKGQTMDQVRKAIGGGAATSRASPPRP